MAKPEYSNLTDELTAIRKTFENSTQLSNGAHELLVALTKHWASSENDNEPLSETQIEEQRRKLTELQKSHLMTTNALKSLSEIKF